MSLNAVFENNKQTPEQVVYTGNDFQKTVQTDQVVNMLF